MSADLTTLAVAIIGVAGTLSSPLLGQRITARAKQQEFDLQGQQRQEEREEAQRQSAFELRRSTYAGLNTAARQYQQELEAYLRMIADSDLTDEARSELGNVRRKFRDLYSEAQMILPDKVLEGAISVSADLGEGYGIARRLEIGKPRTTPDHGPETIEMAQEFAHVTIYNRIVHLRQLMREDLGVSEPVETGN